MSSWLERKRQQISHLFLSLLLPIPIVQVGVIIWTAEISKASLSSSFTSTLFLTFVFFYSFSCTTRSSLYSIGTSFGTLSLLSYLADNYYGVLLVQHFYRTLLRMVCQPSYTYISFIPETSVGWSRYPSFQGWPKHLVHLVGITTGPLPVSNIWILET